jgi:hypothetical protein
MIANCAQDRSVGKNALCYAQAIIHKLDSFSKVSAQKHNHWCRIVTKQMASDVF